MKSLKISMGSFANNSPRHTVDGSLESYKKTVRGGFTLIEALVVISIFSMIGGLGLIVSLDSYRGYAFRSERDSIVRTLSKARSQSLSNVCIGTSCVDGKMHGVRVEQGIYTIFQGPTFASRDSAVDEVMRAQSNNVHITAGGPADIVFAQLSAEVLSPSTITVTDDSGHSSTITINNAGRISWTN